MADDIPPPQDDIDRAIYPFAQRESGWRNVFSDVPVPGYTKEQTGSGYWQIIPSTWKQGAQWAGVDTSQYPLAINAPFDVQRSVARALYQHRGGQPWAQSAPGGGGSGQGGTMPDGNQQQSIDYSPLIQQLLSQSQLPGVDQTPVNRSWTSLLGEAVGGGAPFSADMSPADREAAGNRSLLAFGMGMLSRSGYSPVKQTLGEAVATGLGQAMQSETGSGEAAYTMLGQRQKLAMEQQTMRLNALKEALPLLQLQQRMGLPNPFAQGGGGGGGGAAPAPSPNAPGALAAKPPAAPAGGSPAAPAAPGGGGGGALPLPPVAPPGAVPTVSTPAEATATAKAAGSPVQVPGTQGLWATPQGNLTSTPHVVMPGTDVAGPAVPTTPPATAPAAPATPTTPQQPTPGAPRDISGLRDTELSLPEFQTRYRTPLPADAGVVAVDQGRMAELQRNLSAAQQAYTVAQNTPGGDMNRASQAVTAATKAIADLQEQASQQTVANKIQLQKQQDEQLAAAYKDAKDREAATALETQRGTTQENIERIKAGMSYHQKLEEQAAEYAQTNTIKPMAEQALKAHQMNLSLAQMQPLLQDLPPGGGSVGMLLDAHPELAPMLNAAGVINDRQADTTRIINGLVANISTQMKPQGLGALREYEWDAFKAQLPSMLSTPAGQQKAVALLMNMNNRIQQESSWMQNYFSRKVPDESSTTPGAMRTAHNLETEGSQSIQQRMDAELGPVVPRYTGPPTGSGQAQWEQSLPPGTPYYKTWAVPDPKNPTQPLRDSNGKVTTRTTLEVRPWQQ